MKKISKTTSAIDMAKIGQILLQIAPTYTLLSRFGPFWVISLYKHEEMARRKKIFIKRRGHH